MRSRAPHTTARAVSESTSHSGVTDADVGLTSDIGHPHRLPAECDVRRRVLAHHIGGNARSMNDDGSVNHDNDIRGTSPHTDGRSAAFGLHVLR